ncbi:hypothetical protein HAX39_25605, partial [Citrobacter freundii]|nr:hypothetical protein [Citrobacter freundii]
MINFTPEDVALRREEAGSKLAISEVTGVEKTAREAELDNHFAELMSKIIKDQETNLNAFFR